MNNEDRTKADVSAAQSSSPSAASRQEWATATVSRAGAGRQARSTPHLVEARISAGHAGSRSHRHVQQDTPELSQMGETCGGHLYRTSGNGAD